MAAGHHHEGGGRGAERGHAKAQQDGPIKANGDGRGPQEAAAVPPPPQVWQSDDAVSQQRVSMCVVGLAVLVLGLGLGYWLARRRLGRELQPVARSASDLAAGLQEVRRLQVLWRGLAEETMSAQTPHEARTGPACNPALDPITPPSTQESPPPPPYVPLSLPRAASPPPPEPEPESLPQSPGPLVSQGCTHGSSGEEMEEDVPRDPFPSRSPGQSWQEDLRDKAMDRVTPTRAGGGGSSRRLS